MSAVMGFSEIIGRRVRLGDWQDQKISTYRKIHEALDEGRFEDARRARRVLRRRGQGLLGALPPVDPRPRGLPARRGRRRPTSWRRSPSRSRARSCCRTADRSTRTRTGRAFNELIDEVDAPPPSASDAAAARPLMDEAKEIWRQTHDRDVDHTYGLMSAISERFGETHAAADVRARAAAAVRLALREVRHRQAPVGRGLSRRSCTSRARRCAATSSAPSAPATWS